MIPHDVLERGEHALVELVRAIVREELDARQPETASPASPKWLTVAQAAALLCCSCDAVRMRVKRERLEARKQGRRLYISAESIERLG